MKSQKVVRASRPSSVYAAEVGGSGWKMNCDLSVLCGKGFLHVRMRITCCSNHVCICTSHRGVEQVARRAMQLVCRVQMLEHRRSAAFLSAREFTQVALSHTQEFLRILRLQPRAHLHIPPPCVVHAPSLASTARLPCPKRSDFFVSCILLSCIL